MRYNIRGSNKENTNTPAFLTGLHFHDILSYITMKSNCLILLFLLFFSPLLMAEELIFTSYQRSFLRASLASKSAVLLDALNDDRADEFMGELYDFSLRYILENGQVLNDDPDMINLAVTTIKGIGRTGKTSSAESLWNVFLVFNNSLTRSEILDALRLIGRNNSIVTENLNRFLIERSNDYKLGYNVDLSVVRAVVDVLSSLGDSASYQVLFTAGLIFPPPVSVECIDALGSIKGDLIE